MALPATLATAPGSRRTNIAAGLVGAALLASKATNVVFAAFFFSSALAFAFIDKERPTASILRLAGWTFASVLPWLVLHGPHYVEAWRSHAAAESVPTTAHTALLAQNLPLHWGATVYAYDLAAAIAAGGALAGMWLLHRRAVAAKGMLEAAALCLAAAMTFVASTVPFDIPHAVRYSAPVLAAGAPVAMLLAGRAAGRFGTAAGVVLVAALGVAFGASLMQRTEKLAAWRTTLAEPGDMQAFVAYTAWSLGADTRDWVRRAQAHVPPGERVFALIACPHDLLFARNPVYVGSEFGVTMPWLDLPLDADAATLRRFLEQRGVRYVIWQIGAGMKSDERLQQQLTADYPEERRLARYLLSFRHSLAQLTRASRVLHQEDGLTVLEVSPGAGR